MTTIYTTQFLEALKKKPEAPMPSPSVPEDAADSIKEVKNPQGHLIMKIPYKEGKINGTYEAYNPGTGQLIQTIQYMAGKMQGMMTAYDVHQQMTHQIPYVAGKKEGKATFFLRGSKVSEITYAEDQMNGPSVLFGPGEHVSARLSYKDNLMEGSYEAFNGDQKLVKKCTYSQGKLNGLCQQFYPGGQVFEEATYMHGRVQGELKKYQQNGSLLEISTYNDEGRLISHEKFDAHGKSLGKEEIAPAKSKEIHG